RRAGLEREPARRRALDRLHHVAQGDRRRIARQHVAAAGAALAGHQPGAPQALEDLLEVARRDALALADRLHRHGLALSVVGEIEDAADRILRLDREAHGREGAGATSRESSEPGSIAPPPP